MASNFDLCVYVHTPTGIHCTYPYQNVPTYTIIKTVVVVMMMIKGHVVHFLKYIWLKKNQK